MAQERTVLYEGSEIRYVLEEKPVKNLNLRIHKDCKVYVSANPDIPAEKVDGFVSGRETIFARPRESFLKWRSIPFSPGSMSAARRFICWAEESA